MTREIKGRNCSQCQRIAKNSIWLEYQSCTGESVFFKVQSGSERTRKIYHGLAFLWAQKEAGCLWFSMQPEGLYGRGRKPWGKRL